MADRVTTDEMPLKVSGDYLYATEVEAIRLAIAEHADELEEIFRRLVTQLGIPELVLPQDVVAGQQYLTATGVWVPLGTFNATDSPTAGPKWRLVVGLSGQSGTTVAGISDATEAGRRMLRAVDAAAQRALINNPSIAAGDYGDHPSFSSTDNPTTGLYQWLIRHLLALSGAVQAGRPNAPTQGQVDDRGDTFSFLPDPASPSFAQYKVNGLPDTTGAEWLNSANSYVQNGRIYVRVVGEVDAGGLAVYVGASGNIPDGQVLSNDKPFTINNRVPPVPGALVVDFSVSTATLRPGESLDFVAKASGGTAPYQHSVQALNPDSGTAVDLGTASTASFLDTWPNVPEGVYLVTDTVTDAAGTSLASTARRVVVSVPGGGTLTSATRKRIDFQDQESVLISHGFPIPPITQVFDSDGFELIPDRRVLPDGNIEIQFGRPETGFIIY
jgi:hypothetical protein